MRRGFAALALAMGLVSCAGSPPPRDAFHRLAVPAPAARSEAALSGTVVVSRLEASAVLRGRAIVSADAGREGRLEKSAYHFWSDPPATLVQQSLATFLREGGHAERAVLPEVRADARHRVSGYLYRFERVAGGGSARAVVEVELTLRDLETREVRLSERYEVREAAADASMDATVDAFGRALASIYGRFGEAIARLP